MLVPRGPHILIVVSMGSKTELKRAFPQLSLLRSVPKTVLQLMYCPSAVALSEEAVALSNDVSDVAFAGARVCGELRQSASAALIANGRSQNEKIVMVKEDAANLRVSIYESTDDEESVRGFSIYLSIGPVKSARQGKANCSLPASRPRHFGCIE